MCHLPCQLAAPASACFGRSFLLALRQGLVQNPPAYASEATIRPGRADCMFLLGKCMPMKTEGLQFVEPKRKGYSIPFIPVFDCMFYAIIVLFGTT